MARMAQRRTVTRRANERTWKKDPVRTHMIMELAPRFSATVLAVVCDVERSTIYRNCPNVGIRRDAPPETAELLLEGLNETRARMLDHGEWPENVMSQQAIDRLNERMDLERLHEYTYALAGALGMRPLHLRMFALELAMAVRAVHHWMRVNINKEESSWI
jgi:hypothetical protein